MTREYDIIMLGLFRWHGPYSSISIAMAKEFSKQNRIFYINHPFSYKDYFTSTIRQAKQKPALISQKVIFEKDDKLSANFIAVTSPLTFPVNFLPKGKTYNFFAKKNHIRLFNTIQQINQQYAVEKYIYINCFDPYFPMVLPKAVRPALTVYQSVDDITQDTYTAKHGAYLEESAIKNADVTLVTSQELYRLKSPIAKNIHILNNAADLSIFKQALDRDYEKPKEIKHVSGKIIGYMGNLDEVRVDYHLLKNIALAHSEKTLLLVGPINSAIYKTIGLDQLPNVIFTGGKSIEELPIYLRHFDCAIIPFNCNTLTKSIYPLKINEYLAAGKAVVSTNFSSDIAGFESHIFLARDASSFIPLIDKALQSTLPEIIEKRLAIAKKNTWTARIEQFWEIMGQYLP